MAPLIVAVHLSKNQRFEEAQRWFHRIFDPTCTDTSIAPPQRFWRFLPIPPGDYAGVYRRTARGTCKARRLRDQAPTREEYPGLARIIHFSRTFIARGRYLATSSTC